MTVRLASVLRTHAGGASTVELDLDPPATVEAAIEALAAAHPAIGRRVRDEAGAVRRHVNIFVGADNARDLEQGLATQLSDGAEISVLPAISGG